MTENSSGPYAGTTQGIAASYTPPPQKLVIHEQDHRILVLAGNEQEALGQAITYTNNAGFEVSKVGVIRANPDLARMVLASQDWTLIPNAGTSDTPDGLTLFVVEISTTQRREFRPATKE